MYYMRLVLLLLVITSCLLIYAVSETRPNNNDQTNFDTYHYLGDSTGINQLSYLAPVMPNMRYLTSQVSYT